MLAKMLQIHHAVGFPIVCCVALFAGCQSEIATVRFDLDIRPQVNLPSGLEALYVAPAAVGENMDVQWSDLTAGIVRSLVQGSIVHFGTPLVLVDRENVEGAILEAESRAAGISMEPGGEPPKLLAANGRIIASVNVKKTEERTVGMTTDITRIGGEGEGGQGGGGDVELKTREVEGWRRTVIVQTEFSLLDQQNRQWRYLAEDSRPIVHETAPPSPLFGASRGLGDLPALDPVIYLLVTESATHFVSDLMPVRYPINIEVHSSDGKECREGVKQLRGQFYEEAITFFKAALENNWNDHRAAYGAGVACEAMGRFDEALAFYQQACVLSGENDYIGARQRLERYAGRLKIAK